MPVFRFQENVLFEDQKYAPEEMTYANEEEVFPLVSAALTTAQEEASGNDNAKPNQKRKAPEKGTDKKVYLYTFSSLLFLPLFCMF